MTTHVEAPPPTEETLAVGPFTGFGNFFRKELRDWWSSWRLIIILAIPTLVSSLSVFFAFTQLQNVTRGMASVTSREQLGTWLLLEQYRAPVLYIFIIIFSTMGLLTSEKSTGTLAWNLTKPLGRSGLLVAKWVAATSIVWLAMCVFPTLISAICLKAYHGMWPLFDKMAPVILAAYAWIGLWVLLILTISLWFQSMAAVGGVAIAFWVIPSLFGVLLGEIFGKEGRDWILDRFAANAPFWSFTIFADDDIIIFGKKEWKNVWLYSFGVWTLGLSVFSLRYFSRQEIGS